MCVFKVEGYVKQPKIFVRIENVFFYLIFNLTHLVFGFLIFVYIYIYIYIYILNTITKNEKIFVAVTASECSIDRPIYK